MEQTLDVEKRTKSILTGCSTEVLYTLKDFPIHMMESDKSFSSDMVFAIGEKDGFIQLENIIPPEKLYIDTHFNSPGKVWENHYIAVSEVIGKYSDKPLEILEIGGGSGRLNKTFVDRYDNDVKWKIIEPQPCPVEGCRATFIKGLFPDAIDSHRKYDMIVHTCFIEHVTNLNDFISSSASLNFLCK